MSHNILIQSNQQTFSAGNSETILEAALKQHVNLPYGCRNGACGSCKARLIDGKIRYGNTPINGLTAEEAESGYILLCQAMPLSDLVIDARTVNSIGDIPVRKLPCRVTRIEKLNHDVLRLFLKLPTTERIQFLAGQYIDILMQGGKRRSFSLANAPHDDEFLELHVRHYDGGLFSEFAFNKLHEKSLLRIEGPLGTFFLREDSDRPMIMVAGGTGFAPVKSIVEHAINKGINRPIYLYWGARSRRDLYLNELAEQWANELENFYYVPVLSEPLDTDRWQGKSGFVHNIVLEDFTDLSGYEVYTCGPPPLVHAVRDTFIERGLSGEYIYSDSFEFAPKI